MKNAIITKERYSFTCQIDIQHYRCTNCEEDDIERGYNYCPNCGIKIKWSL